MLLKILGNVIKNSGECSGGFHGKCEKILGNVPEDSRECYERFRGTFEQILWNLNFHLFL